MELVIELFFLTPTSRNLIGSAAIGIQNQNPILCSLKTNGALGPHGLLLIYGVIELNVKLICLEHGNCTSHED